MSTDDYNNNFSFYSEEDLVPASEKIKASMKQSQHRKENDESFELKMEHVFQQFCNDLYAHMDKHQNFDWGAIEKILIKNLETKFNYTKVAELSCVSVRTIRNKRNETRV